MASLREITKVVARLPKRRLGVLLDLAVALGRDIAVNVDKKSDIATKAFVEDFSGRLLTYHAFHEQKLTKKTFEFAFRGASRAAGREAEITASSVNPGADVTVDGVAFSLKTEGAKSMKKSSITISKFMEARWIRDCLTPNDFASEVSRRVVEHLKEYERILTLRAFEDQQYFEYDLVEIPLKLLFGVKNLKKDAFSPRTPSGGSSARVVFKGGKAFTLRLDGSVEKVTVSGIKTSLCIRHATWRVSRQSR